MCVRYEHIRHPFGSVAAAVVLQEAVDTSGGTEQKVSEEEEEEEEAVLGEEASARFSVCCHLSCVAKRDQQSSAHRSIFS